jgi:signal transduction histidine kinase
MDHTVIEDASARRLRQRLHDGLGQSLSLAAMQIDQAIFATGMDTLRRARMLLGDALDEVRSLIANVEHATEEAAPDLPCRMLACVRSLNARQPIPVDCTVEGSSTAMPAQACEILLFATQELLVNACKHGRADRVEVRLSFQPHRLSITVAEQHLAEAAALLTRTVQPSLGLGLGLRATHLGLDRIGARLRWRNGGRSGVQARISWVRQ